MDRCERHNFLGIVQLSLLPFLIFNLSGAASCWGSAVLGEWWNRWVQHFNLQNSDQSNLPGDASAVFFQSLPRALSTITCTSTSWSNCRPVSHTKHLTAPLCCKGRWTWTSAKHDVVCFQTGLGRLISLSQASLTPAGPNQQERCVWAATQRRTPAELHSDSWSADRRTLLSSATFSAVRPPTRVTKRARVSPIAGTPHTHVPLSRIRPHVFIRSSRGTFAVAGSLLQGSLVGLVAALSNRRLRVSAVSCHSWCVWVPQKALIYGLMCHNRVFSRR